MSAGAGVRAFHPEQDFVEGADVFDEMDGFVAAGVAEAGLAVPSVLGQ